jgi:hypothetical protein
MPHTTISDRNARLFEDTLTYTVDNQHTEGVNLQGYPILGLLVPVINAGTVTVEISLDDGSTWLSLKDADGSTASISITGGGTAFFVSSDVFTPLAAYCAHLRGDIDLLVRLVTGATQTADRTFTWIGVA